MQYLVNDIYPCIQGEGVNTGVPMILLRLHGCPVECVFCDTKETWTIDPTEEVNALEKALGTSPRYARVSAETIADKIDELNPDKRVHNVLLTGGEPATQDLAELVSVLHDRNYACNLETSGTVTGHVGAEIDWVCLSPKIGNPGKLPILPEALGDTNEITWVVGKESDLTEMWRFLSEFSRYLPDDVQMCLQPLSQSRKATDLCIETCQKKGFRLSAQVHKYLHLR